MNRLQQKCAIASAGLHSLLLLVLVVGPAFVAPKNRPEDDLPILDYVVFKTTDDKVFGGGNPNGGLPAPPPPPPPVRQATPPPPVEKPAPEVPKSAPQEAQRDDPAESSLIPATKKVAKPVISTKLVTRKQFTRTRPEENSSAQEEERAAQEAARQRQRLAEVFGKAASRLEHGVAGGTAIDIKDLQGPGGGGLPYANFYQAVKSVYARTWVLPDGIDDDEATATASVTIARDGKVVSTRFLRSSGNVAVDQSVRVVLERVKYAAPLPDTEKQDTRTVSINFNVKAKKALG